MSDSETVEVPRDLAEEVRASLLAYAQLLRDSVPDARSARALERWAAEKRDGGDLEGARRLERRAAELLAQVEAGILGGESDG